MLAISMAVFKAYIVDDLSLALTFERSNGSPSRRTLDFLFKHADFDKPGR